MRHLKKYNNLESINESWFESAIIRSDYNRDDEIREFFLELTDLGGRVVGIRNATHTIVDDNFELKNRINYLEKPLYKAYTLGLRFEELSQSISNTNVDNEMSKTIDFFNELDDALMNIKDFGYKFKLKKFTFEPKDNGISFNIVLYKPEDVIPWEHIFTKE
jgi:hypothetical protein